MIDGQSNPWTLALNAICGSRSMPRLRHGKLRVAPYKNIIKSGGLPTTKAGKSRPEYRYWTPEEADQLAILWAANVSYQGMSELLGRSVHAIKYKLWKLKIISSAPPTYKVSDNADPFMVWIFGELEFQEIQLQTILDATKITYDRLYDLRMRGYVPLMSEVNSLLKLTGHKIEIVPTVNKINDANAHNARIHIT